MKCKHRPTASEISSSSSGGSRNNEKNFKNENNDDDDVYDSVECIKHKRCACTKYYAIAIYHIFARGLLYKRRSYRPRAEIDVGVSELISIRLCA